MKLLNTKSIKSSGWYRWVCDFCNKSVVAKFIVTVCIWGVASIPFDLYLLVRWGVDPEGFWQELAMLVVWGIVLGWLQALLIFIGIMLTMAVILDDF
jgi:hypothetical protein